jgi:hypothetical protein
MQKIDQAVLLSNEHLENGSAKSDTSRNSSDDIEVAVNEDFSEVRPLFLTFNQPPLISSLPDQRYECKLNTRNTNHDPN